MLLLVAVIVPIINFPYSRITPRLMYIYIIYLYDHAKGFFNLKKKKKVPPSIPGVGRLKGGT